MERGHSQHSPLLLASPPSAVREVLPTLHEAAPPEPEGEPPPAARRPHAVRPLPQRHRPLAGAGPAVLEVGVHTGENGRRQGNQSYDRAETTSHYHPHIYTHVKHIYSVMSHSDAHAIVLEALLLSENSIRVSGSAECPATLFDRNWIDSSYECLCQTLP